MQLRALQVKSSRLTSKEIQFFLTTQLGAFVLAYGVRATVNFCLYLIRILRGK